MGGWDRRAALPRLVVWPQGIRWGHLKTDGIPLRPSTGRPDALSLEGWEQNDKLFLLNLHYDLTPPELVTVIVTELGLLPPTSVPVVIRETRREFQAAGL